MIKAGKRASSLGIKAQKFGYCILEILKKEMGILNHFWEDCTLRRNREEQEIICNNHLIL
jgi:hypothetical protein